MLAPIPPKRILVAPLNWGLGHATRLIPVIDLLLQKGMEVILAGDGRSLALLKHSYPKLPHLELPPYDIRYSKTSRQVGAMLRQFPKLIGAIRAEHQALIALKRELRIDAIISDNRYGLWHTEIPSVCICHQLAIKLPDHLSMFRWWVYRIHRHLLSRFHACWIPDVAARPNLSAALSHTYKPLATSTFIGPLSRFSQKKPLSSSFSYPELKVEDADIVAILSGPEPQRTLLEDILTEQAHNIERNIWIIQGKTEARQLRRNGNLWKISFMDTADLGLLFHHAKVIISRSGYSSLMDYAALGLEQVILIPTPGQTEQEYLAQHLHQQQFALVCKQLEFQLVQALDEVKSVKGFEKLAFTSNLDSILDDFLEHPSRH